MIKIGITGHNGFIAKHLINTLKITKDEFSIIPFDRDYFNDNVKLELFVYNCDVIVHLAALNRHNQDDVIYNTNLALASKLVDALDKTNSRAHLIVSSSTQEERDNSYGRSKKDSRLLFAKWANRSNGLFTGMIIPNVFGPFGNPNYNSVIATFCHQISRGEKPVIEIDVTLKLIYVQELISEILLVIKNKINNHQYLVSHTEEYKVTEILNLLSFFYHEYQIKSVIPFLKNKFEYLLFNTYRCYIDIPNFFPRIIKKNEDDRGAFVEIARCGISGQTSFSTTLPGITRGNHFHTRKIERFAVINGKALIQLRKIGSKEIHQFYLDGDTPSFVDMPIWYTHNIKNIGDEILFTIFWINEPYDPQNPDTYFENV